MFTKNWICLSAAMIIVAISLPVQAGTMVWGTAQDISTASSDMLTTGSPVYAYAFGATGPQTVEGVSFDAGTITGGGTDVAVAFSNQTSSGCAIFLSSPASYGDLLKGAVYANGTGAEPLDFTVTLNNLVVNQQYAVQVWHRNVEYPGSGTTFDGQVLLTAQPTGQYAIGTFTADATSQVMQLTGANVQINALQLRQVPEPSALIMLSAGLLGLLCYAWRKRR